MFKKGICALVLLFAAGGASATTLTLATPVSCGTLKQCENVPTDDPATTVSVYGGPGYPFFYVYLNVTDATGIVHTTEYKANQSSVGQLTLVPAQSGQLVCGPACVWVPTGSVIYFSGLFNTSLTCTRSGRGQHCTTHYTLVSGSVDY